METWAGVSHLARKAAGACRGRRFTDEDGVCHEMKCSDAAVPCDACCVAPRIEAVIREAIEVCKACARFHKSEEAIRRMDELTTEEPQTC